MLVPIVEIAVTADMPRLVAVVAGLGAVRAVAADVAGLVAVIARQRRTPFTLLASLGAVARDVAHFGAVVAGWLVGALRTITRYVSGSVTPITSISLLLAVPGKMSLPVALVALFAAPAVAAVPAAVAAVAPAVLAAAGGSTAATASAPRLGALPGKVAGPVALIANCGTHACWCDV